MYKEDRNVLMQSRTSENTANDKHAHTSVKPRSIIIDKQYISEPSSPILEKHPKEMMLRNYSDLSSRIRKRVTYRLNSAPLPKPVANEQAESKLRTWMQYRCVERRSCRRSNKRSDG
ncbi:hypothetical protein DPMN_069215 [Dreissena polymorpha]|uniref:Uncharacterized protein n=1 Tax=Dreissena polymorpha TaxID=45954 RepID=A0A9D3Z2T3_DREPO|nr:hypothetical protein DPMN_069215 [Dreissena polymorpha]